MIEPKTYRKKPVHVKAMKFTGANSNDVARFVGEEDDGIPYGKNCDYFEIETLEGDMKVSKGDYIIRGVAGEFYPCKPDIFAATYEEVDQDGQRVNSTQYPENPKTAMMTVAAVLEWLEGEKDDLETDRVKVGKKSGGAFGDEVDKQLRIGAMTIDILLDKLTKSTFEQMDEAYGNE